MDLANDFIKFLDVFGQMVSESTPHLYISALPFVPTDSKIHELFSSSFPRLLSIPKGKLTSWPPIRQELHHEDLMDFTFTLDGTKFISASSESIRTFNLVNGTTTSVGVPKLEQLQQPVRYVTASPSGRYVAVYSDYIPSIGRKCQGVVCVCDIETGDLISLHEATNPKKYVVDRDCTCQVYFSANEEVLIAAFLDGHIYAWDLVGSGDLTTPRGRMFDNVIREAIAISPDGNLMATGTDVISIWDTRNGSLIRRDDSLGQCYSALLSKIFVLRLHSCPGIRRRVCSLLRQCWQESRHRGW